MYYAEKAVNFVETVSKHVPPCVLFSVICTFFNGWNTSARFQVLDKVCLICSECQGFDSIEHYACCSYQWPVFGKKFRTSVFPMSLPRFLGVLAEEVDDMVFHACHMYAVQSAVRSRWKDQIITGPDAVEALIWQGHRTALALHSGLRRRYRNLWQS